MIRWKYVLPRLLLLIAASIGLGWGLDPVLRWGLSRSAQRMMGSRVEIGRFETSPLRGTICIDGVAVGDQDRAFRNLMQFDRARLEVDMHAALRRKLIVRDGHLEGLQLNTDRRQSGRLPPAVERTQDDQSMVSSRLAGAAERGEAWFNHQLGDWQRQLENDLHTLRLGRELADRWPAAYDDLQRRADHIEQQGSQLRDGIQTISDDPLRHLDKVQPWLTSAERLRRDVLGARDRLLQLQQQMHEDRLAIDAAREHDERYVRQRLRVDELDGQSLTEYLLGHTWAQRLEIAVRWLRRSRDVLPPASTDYAVERASRGIRVVFPGFSATPDLLVRQLQLSGEGRVDQDPYYFSGTLRDLTHQPGRHEQPATFELRSDGAIQLVARAVLDRRNNEPLDRLTVDVPALRQCGVLLGDPENFCVALSPGIARIHADVALLGERLTGRVTMQQDQVQLTPAMKSSHATWMSPESLADSFRAVDRLDAQIELSGTLAAPRYEMASNLGDQLAAGLNRAMQQELARQEQRVVSRAQEEVEQQLADLEGRLAAKQGKLLEKLERSDAELNQLRQQLLSQVGGPDDLISRGRQLFSK